MSRYFKVTDQTIIDGLKAHFEKRDKLKAVAAEWALAHGAEAVQFYRDGLFGQHIGGFKPRDCTTELREKCTQKRDRNGLVRPKKTADKALYESYQKIYGETRVDSRETDDLIGFGELSFFPTSPGFRIKPGDNFVGWIMPDHVTEVKGCVEITNIDWIEATKAAEDA